MSPTRTSPAARQLKSASEMGKEEGVFPIRPGRRSQKGQRDAGGRADGRAHLQACISHSWRVHDGQVRLKVLQKGGDGARSITSGSEPDTSLRQMGEQPSLFQGRCRQTSACIHGREGAEQERGIVAQCGSLASGPASRGKPQLPDFFFM